MINNKLNQLKFYYFGLRYRVLTFTHFFSGLHGLVRWSPTGNHIPVIEISYTSPQQQQYEKYVDTQGWLDLQNYKSSKLKKTL